MPSYAYCWLVIGQVGIWWGSRVSTFVVLINQAATMLLVGNHNPCRHSTHALRVLNMDDALLSCCSGSLTYFIIETVLMYRLQYEWMCHFLRLTRQPISNKEIQRALAQLQHGLTFTARVHAEVGAASTTRLSFAHDNTEAQASTPTTERYALVNLFDWLSSSGLVMWNNIRLAASRTKGARKVDTNLQILSGALLTTMVTLIMYAVNWFVHADNNMTLCQVYVDYVF